MTPPGARRLNGGGIQTMFNWRRQNVPRQEYREMTREGFGNGFPREGFGNG
jgi:hypothetical protein